MRDLPYAEIPDDGMDAFLVVLWPSDYGDGEPIAYRAQVEYDELRAASGRHDCDHWECEG